MHDVRFKQMEYTLPEEYQHEQELERQRKIHDSLITRGLQLISDSYLDVMKAACDRAGLPLEYKTFDGKNFTMLMMVTMGIIRENSRGPFLISGEMTIQGQQDVRTAQPTPAPQSTP